MRTVTGVNNGGGKPLTGKEPWSAKTQCFCRDRTLPAIARVRVRSYSLKTLETAESFIHPCTSPSRHAPEILAYLYILTASAPDWLCCAVLCEMVTMDRSTAPSQFSILYSRGQSCRLPKSPEHLECIRFGPLQWLRPSQVAAGREHTGRRAVRACVYATASPEDPHECRGRGVRSAAIRV